MPYLMFSARSRSLTMAAAIGLAGCTTVPESVREFESSEMHRTEDIRTSAVDRTLELQRANDNEGLVRHAIATAARYRAANAPISEADALGTAAVYSPPDAGVTYLSRAIQILETLKPTNRLDREMRDRGLVTYASSAALLVQRANGDMEQVVRFAGVARATCAGATERILMAMCNPAVADGFMYRAALAAAGDESAQRLVREQEARARKRFEDIRAVAARFTEAQQRKDHRSVADAGSTLIAELADQRVDFLPALIELFRAEALRGLGDEAGSNAAAAAGRDRVAKAGSLEDHALDYESTIARQTGLDGLANILDREHKVLGELTSRRGLGWMDSGALSFSPTEKDLAEVRQIRASLDQSTEQLQSRGAPLLAYWTRTKARTMLEKEQEMVRNMASEREAVQQAKEEEAKRSADDWQQLAAAVSFASNVRQGIDAQNAANELRRLQEAERASQQRQRPSTQSPHTGQTARDARQQPGGAGPSAGPSDSTAGQMQSGNARDIRRSPPGGGRESAPANAKFSSRMATNCVEIVPKGFKCSGPNERFLTNICSVKVSVKWRLGSDSWGMQDLEPAQCYPVSYYKDDRVVQHVACAWDPAATYGPIMDGCRY